MIIMNDIWQTVLGVIVSIGGAGAIIVFVTKLTAEKLAECLAKKYQLTLDKELEKYKSQLGKKNYVSQVRFDAEFKMYQELSEAINRLCMEYKCSKLEVDIGKIFNDVQSVIMRHAPFISEKMCNLFTELKESCRPDVEQPVLIEQVEKQRVELENNLREYLSNLEVMS